MLETLHLNEWLNSGVDREIINLNVRSLSGTTVYDYLLYGNKISRRNDGRLRDRDLKKYQHIELGGWWCSGVDPLKDYQLMIWGCFKPNKPRRNIGEKNKIVKYEHPFKEPTQALFLRVTWAVGLKIATTSGLEQEYSQRLLQAQRTYQTKATGFGVPTEIDEDKESEKWLKTEDKGFWQWVWSNNIPITITEGAKKAGALLSAGYAACAIPGITGGYRNPKDEFGQRLGNPYLIPELQHFATRGREITICFDFETKPQTLNNLNAALAQTARLLSIAGGSVRIAQLPGQEKGVDDFIVARGAAAFEEIYQQALTFEQWQVAGYNNLTYEPNLSVNQRYLGEIIFAQDAKLIGVKSAKGTGKTTGLKTIVERAIKNGQPVLLLTHRVQLGQVLAAEVGIPYITEVRDNETGKLLGYGLCVDSLRPNSQARFRADGWSNALVIIDEVEQVIWHTLTASTEVKRHRVEVIQQLGQLLHNVLTSPRGRVIVCDADLSDLSIQFILGMAGVDIKPWIVVNDWKPDVERLCYHYNQTTPVVWFAALEQHITDGGRPCIVTHSQKTKSTWSTKNLEARLKKQFPHLRILRIDSESIKDPTHPAYGCTSNLNEILLEVDIVIASPSIETGISIDIKEHITSVWGCFHGVSPENSARQSLARVREDVSRHLWVAPRGLGLIGNGALNLKSLLASEHKVLKANLRLLQDASLQLDEDCIHVSQAAINIFGKMACRVNAGMIDYRRCVLAGLKSEGYKIIELDTPADDDTKKITAELKNHQKTNYQQECTFFASVDTSTMTPMQLEALQQQVSKTPTERALCRKYSLEQRYHVDVTPDLVAKDDDGWYPQLRLHYFLTIGKPHLPQRDAKVAGGMIHNGKLWMPDFNDGQLGTMVGALEILGIRELIENPRPLRASDEDLQRLLSFVQANRPGMKSIFNLTFTPKSQPIATLRRLINKLGLRLNKIGRDGTGDREWIYQIIGDDDGREQVFAAWQQKRYEGRGALEQRGFCSSAPEHLCPSALNSSTSTNGNKEIINQQQDADHQPPTERDSWWRAVKHYAQQAIKCFEFGVGAVLEALKNLGCDQRWGVMLAFEEEAPVTFAQFIEAAPNWVEWCNC